MAMSSSEWQESGSMVTWPLASSLQYPCPSLNWKAGLGGLRRGPARDNCSILDPR